MNIQYTNDGVGGSVRGGGGGDSLMCYEEAADLWWRLCSGCGSCGLYGGAYTGVVSSRCFGDIVILQFSVVTATTLAAAAAPVVVSNSRNSGVCDPTFLEQYNCLVYMCLN